MLSGRRGRRRHLNVDGLDHQAVGRTGEAGQHGGEFLTETTEGNFVGGQHRQIIRHGLIRQVIGLRTSQVVLRDAFAAQIVQGIDLGLK